MKRRSFLKIGTGLTIAAGLPFAHVAYAKSSATYTYLTPFTLSLSFTPILFASAAGIYQELGLNVKVEAGRGAGQVIQLVSAQRVETGRTGGANYIGARGREGSDVLAFATISQVSPFILISLPEKNIQTTSDLVGKTIGMASFGGSMEATLNLMLAKEGIDPSTIKKERVADGPAAYAMLEAGRIDVAFGNVSTVSRLMAENLEISTMNVDDGIPGQVYIAREDDLKNNEEQHIKFLRGAHKAIQQLLKMDDDELKEALKVIAKNFDVPGIDREDIALSDLKGNMKLWTAHGEENILRNVPEAWATAQQLLADANIIAKTEQKLYTNKIWEKAVV